PARARPRASRSGCGAPPCRRGSPPSPPCPIAWSRSTAAVLRVVYHPRSDARRTMIALRWTSMLALIGLLLAGSTVARADDAGLLAPSQDDVLDASIADAEAPSEDSTDASLDAGA